MPEHPRVMKKPDDAFVYLASVVDPGSDVAVAPNMVRYQISAGRYALFTHKGPISTFPHTVRYIWGYMDGGQSHTLSRGSEF